MYNLGLCDGAEYESFSEQERFMHMEITFLLRKIGGYKASGLGGRPFPVVRLVGWQANKNLIV